MPYCTQSDIEALIGSDALIELTDLDNIGEVSTVRLASAIAANDALIDAYVGTRYGTPLSPVPAVIKNASVTLAVTALKQLRGTLTAEDTVSRREIIGLLNSIGKGTASLADAATPAVETSNNSITTTTPQPSRFAATINAEWGD